jgi:hypothetical protein
MPKEATKSSQKDKNPSSEVYESTHKIRFLTSASLFDGHVASINILR